MKPILPQVCSRYEIRNTVYHLPKARHTFAEQSLKYCLIIHLNPEGGYADFVHSTSFLNYIIIITNEMINNYSAVCTIRSCYVCEYIQH